MWPPRSPERRAPLGRSSPHVREQHPIPKQEAARQEEGRQWVLDAAQARDPGHPPHRARRPRGAGRAHVLRGRRRAAGRRELGQPDGPGRQPVRQPARLRRRDAGSGARVGAGGLPGAPAHRRAAGLGLGAAAAEDTHLPPHPHRPLAHGRALRRVLLRLVRRPDGRGSGGVERRPRYRHRRVAYERAQARRVVHRAPGVGPGDAPAGVGPRHPDLAGPGRGGRDEPALRPGRIVGDLPRRGRRAEAAPRHGSRGGAGRTGSSPRRRRVREADPKAQTEARLSSEKSSPRKKASTSNSRRNSNPPIHR